VTWSGTTVATGRALARRWRGVGAEVVTFAVIGAASTVVHLGGFVLLRQAAEPQLANTVALLVAAVANTWANRRWTFGIRGRAGAARHQLQGLLVLVLTLGMTSGGLALLARLVPGARTGTETLVVAATTVAATAVKYAAMRWWVFAPSRTGPPPGDADQSSTTANDPPASSNSTAPVHS
jgi:putative flippase GtrA